MSSSKHSQQKKAAASNVVAQVCRYDGHCTKAGCPFAHPNGKQALVCRYDGHCTRAGCSYAHPSGQLSTTATAVVTHVAVSPARLSHVVIHEVSRAVAVPVVATRTTVSRTVVQQEVSQRRFLVPAHKSVKPAKGSKPV